MFEQYSMYCPHTGVGAKTVFTKCRLANCLQSTTIYKVSVLFNSTSNMFFLKTVVEDGVNRLKVAAIKWKCKLQRKNQRAMT